MDKKIFKLIPACFLAPLACALISCASSSNKPTPTTTEWGINKPAQTPLQPLAKPFDGMGAPVITSIAPLSPADKAGLRVGDVVLEVNGTPVETVADFEREIRFAPPHTALVISRAGKRQLYSLQLNDIRPRDGIAMDPLGKILVRAAAPYVPYVRTPHCLVHTQVSLNNDKTVLHINMILQADQLIQRAPLGVRAYEPGTKKPLLASRQVLPSLTDNPIIISKEVKSRTAMKTPLKVSVALDHRQFLFEFR